MSDLHDYKTFFQYAGMADGLLILLGVYLNFIKQGLKAKSTFLKKQSISWGFSSKIL